MGCNLAREDGLGLGAQKIMICRASARLRGGVNHNALNTSYDRPPVMRQQIHSSPFRIRTEGVTFRLHVPAWRGQTLGRSIVRSARDSSMPSAIPAEST